MNIIVYSDIRGHISQVIVVAGLTVTSNCTITCNHAMNYITHGIVLMLCAIVYCYLVSEYLC